MEGNGHNAPTEFTVKISQDVVTGAIKIEAPMNQPVLVLGLLAFAQHAIADAQARAAENNRIALASAMPPGQLRVT